LCYFAVKYQRNHPVSYMGMCEQGRIRSPNSTRIVDFLHKHKLMDPLYTRR
jgi:hypothetical protein